MDARNISRDTFIRTLNKFEEKCASSIIIINNRIDEATNNIKFQVKITKDDIPDISKIGDAIEQYYEYRGYSVIVNTGDEKNGIDPYIKIYWDLESIEQPYDTNPIRET